MKKHIVILGICVLLVMMPATISISIPNEKQELTTNEYIDEPAQTIDDPPGWANGNFSGVWGLDIWGETHIPLGWIYGYYKNQVKFGYFYAAFADFWGENNTNYLQGLLIGPYMLGALGQNESANETVFVGLGGYNETNFHWRIMGWEGPTFFMHGTYTRFD